MTTQDKIQTLAILKQIPFYVKTKQERETQAMIIQSLKADLIPKSNLPLEMVEVYVDHPHITTTHQTWPEVMDRIEKVRDKEFIYAIHVTRAGEIEYSWEAEKK